MLDSVQYPAIYVRHCQYTGYLLQIINVLIKIDLNLFYWGFFSDLNLYRSTNLYSSPFVGQQQKLKPCPHSNRLLPSACIQSGDLWFKPLSGGPLFPPPPSPLIPTSSPSPYRNARLIFQVNTSSLKNKVIHVSER